MPSVCNQVFDPAHFLEVCEHSIPAVFDRYGFWFIFYRKFPVTEKIHSSPYSTDLLCV